MHEPLASNASQLFSIIIGVYNDWPSLDQCLRSLEQQVLAPNFEVIIIDDGSDEPAPQHIRGWQRCYPLTIATQPHAGVSAARNRGTEISRGPILVFVDADCRLDRTCLVRLAAVINGSPHHNCFQLHLVGHYDGLVGRAEELRLATLQSHLLRSDGRIRYLNTAGVALRRDRVDMKKGVFDVAALRAQDTLLLAEFLRDGETPLFVSAAVVQHYVALSLKQYLLKTARSAYTEGKTYDLIASKGITVSVSHRERFNMMLRMWRTAGQCSIGRAAWFVTVAKQAVSLLGFYAYRCVRLCLS
jgi:glycosyltransferase involved in cell wall biosynthesis